MTDHDNDTASFSARALAAEIQRTASEQAEQALNAKPKQGAPLFFEADGLAIYGTSEQVAEMFAAMPKAKAAFKAIVKNKAVNAGAYRFEYADLGAINGAVDDALSEHGLNIWHPPTRTTSEVVIVHTFMSHANGAFQHSQFKLNHNGKLKDIAGDLTMVQRYCKSKLLGLATDEDADDNPDSKPEPKPRQRRPSTRGTRTPPKADQPPPHTDNDAPPSQPPPVPEEGKRASARAKQDSAAEEPERTPEQFAEIRSLHGKLSEKRGKPVSAKELGEMLEEAVGFNPVKGGARLTVAGADKSIVALKEMVANA